MARKGQKKKKKVRREKNNKNPEKRQRRKRKKVLTKETDPWGDSFIPSMKSKNRIFWMVHWWVLGNSNCFFQAISSAVCVSGHEANKIVTRG
jgi:hypothetical protein